MTQGQILEVTEGGFIRVGERLFHGYYILSHWHCFSESVLALYREQSLALRGFEDSHELREAFAQEVNDLGLQEACLHQHSAASLVEGIGWKKFCQNCGVGMVRV